MDVIDFLKKKKEILAQKSFDVSDMISPTIKDYWAEISQTINAHWHQLLGQVNGEVSTNKGYIPTTAPYQHILDDINAQIGQEYFVGKWYTVEQDQIDQFASVTKDQQWIHTDPEKAKRESPFKQTIAHGFLTLSMIPYLTETVDENTPPFPDAKMCVNYGLNQVRFHFPVKPGNRIRARSRYIGVSEIRKGLEVVMEHTIDIENCRRPACVAQTVMRLYF
ncbi:MaoC family dehydratase [Gynuella sunshinyii]|uniref:Acyl dehydratase n=1 Tax=Gynuella sunshinyii YC6258 TaxID=1445510 RepID=A0A0C5VLL4_9GAMM|nr:MaoC family dehydratase [Gynuella sunshinyii]AJQ95181.1 acyl dehydratase [Gynuella sunshinyii YC6258]